MFQKSLKGSLYTALFVGFIDHLGIGLVYPLFSTMLFDSCCLLLPAQATLTLRGIYLGILFSLMPLTQFLTAPIWGMISDKLGRKKPLQVSLLIAFFGYFIAFIGVLLESILFLLLSRILIGFASGNTSIVQATVADVSKPEEKAKHFGLYSMALGSGFALGPFCSGLLVTFGYSVPFVFTAFLVLINSLFTHLFFKETHTPSSLSKIFSLNRFWTISFSHMKKAFTFKGLRTVFLCSFLNYFGWSYFFEFAPVFLIFRFQFTAYQLGLFFGLAGAFYALSAGLLIRPLLNRFNPKTLFSSGLLFTGISILLIPTIPALCFLWPLLFFVCFFTSLTSPTATTIVSNAVSKEAQGEALGIFTSVNAFALILSPLLSGSFVGNYPTLPMWIGGSTMLLSAGICVNTFRTNPP